MLPEQDFLMQYLAQSPKEPPKVAEIQSKICWLNPKWPMALTQ